MMLSGQARTTTFLIEAASFEADDIPIEWKQDGEG